MEGMRGIQLRTGMEEETEVVRRRKETEWEKTGGGVMKEM